jgi:hypothetical protein
MGRARQHRLSSPGAPRPLVPASPPPDTSGRAAGAELASPDPGWPQPTRERLRGLFVGWLLLAANSGVMLLFLTLDWPILGFVACMAFAILAGLTRLRCGFDGWLIFILLAFAVVLFQTLKLETRISPRALLQPSAMLVSTEGLQVQPGARSVTIALGHRRPVTVQVAAVAAPGWMPGQPVPYWVITQTGGAPQRAWTRPLDQAVLAPAVNVSDARALSREMAAGWGSPMSSIPFLGAPVMIVWAEDGLALVEATRAWFLRVLLVGMAVWPVLLAGSWAVAVVRGWRRKGRSTPA